jgi:hypothetical protein
LPRFEEIFFEMILEEMFNALTENNLELKQNNRKTSVFE